MSDSFLRASQEYLRKRHETALRLLAQCDKQAASPDRSLENELRDQALLALVNRNYQAAADLTSKLAVESSQHEHLLRRRQQLRKECDRLSAALTTLEQRQEMLELAPSIEDPYLGGVSAYLEKRHQTALRLMAAMDAELGSGYTGGEASSALHIRRERLSIEIDALSQAMQIHEQREELLESAQSVMGEGAPDTSTYLRRVLMYLEQRSGIVLKLIASIDSQLGDSRNVDHEQKHLQKQREELVAELDQINEKIAAQKRGETDLKICGLSSELCDPYHIKVSTYLQNRSDVALQLIAFLDQRIADLDSRPDGAAEREQLASRRDALAKEADAALAQMEEQEEGQQLLDSFGVAAKAAA